MLRRHSQGFARRAPRQTFALPLLDLHTTRATIKTQKVLARVSPLDDESKNNQRSVGAYYRALLIFCDDLRRNESSPKRDEKVNIKFLMHPGKIPWHHLLLRGFSTLYEHTPVPRSMLPYRGIVTEYIISTIHNKM